MRVINIQISCFWQQIDNGSFVRNKSEQMINKVFIGSQFGISQISDSKNSHVYTFHDLVHQSINVSLLQISVYNLNLNKLFMYILGVVMLICYSNHSFLHWEKIFILLDILKTLHQYLHHRHHRHKENPLLSKAPVKPPLTLMAMTMLWRHLEKVVLACIILHNMIVEDEKPEDIEENLDLNEPPSTTTDEAPEFSADYYVTFERVLEKDADIRDVSTHKQLKKDLVEHIWQTSRASRNIS